MAKDIDQVATSVPETTTTAAIATARFYVGVATGTPGVSADGWITGASLFNYAPVIPRRNTAQTAVTVTDADIGGMIICTSTTTVTVTIPNNLTKVGSFILRKGGAGNVVLTAQAPVVLALDGNRSTITTTNHGMSVTWDGGLLNYWATGGEA